MTDKFYFVESCKWRTEKVRVAKQFARCGYSKEIGTIFYFRLDGGSWRGAQVWRSLN